MLLLALLLVGCQTPAPTGPATLSLVLHRGFSVPDAPLGTVSPAVGVLADGRGSAGEDSVRRAASFIDSEKNWNSLPPRATA